MVNKFSFFFLILILILPISLITGPAIPDISITLTGLFFIFIVCYKKEFKTVFFSNLFLITFIFWLYLLFISFLSANQYLSFRDSLIFIRILFIPILMYFWFGNRMWQIEKLFLIIFLVIIFITIDTFYQYLNYSPINGFGSDLLGFVPNWYGRLTGPFGDELIPGSYLSRFAFLGWLFLFLKIKKHKNLFYLSIIYFSIVGVTIFATGERMALATYMLGLVFLSLFYKNKRILFIGSLIITLFFIFIANKLHPIYNDYKILESTPYHLGLKVEKTFSCENQESKQCYKVILLQPKFTEVLRKFNQSAYGEIYNLGLTMFKDHKLFGIGLNNFNFLCNNDIRYNNVMKNYSCVSHPHNIYLQWLVEAGIIGLFLFIFYLFYLFYFIIKTGSNVYTLIAITSMISLFWPIMSTGSLLKNWNGISVFFIVGICILLSKFKKSA